MAGVDQILDTNTYGGRTPDATYPTRSSSSDSAEDALKNRHGRPPGPTIQIDTDMLELAGNMTLRELVGQMTQIQIGMLLDGRGRLDLTKVQYWIGEWGVGSFLDTPTKLDSVHGANYVDGSVLFPQQIGLAATFNTILAYEAGRITAKDTRAAGIPWVFAPILDVAVHKLWPRVYESFGEGKYATLKGKYAFALSFELTDPHLVSEMGSAIIKGMQGNYKKDRTRVAACMKHFIGYSASHNGQDKSSAWIPDNYLMDYFVPSFQAAVDAGVATAMETYIDVNGQPVVSSHFYLTELLRHRLGFQGMLVTDWQELDRLYTEHRTAPSLKDAAFQCLKQTSVDMVMVPESESFSVNAMALVQERKLDKQRLVESVAKILQLKKDLGLFEQPLSDPKLLPSVGSQQDIEAARNAARESITVLKNDKSVLPLVRSMKTNGRIVVTGPAANSIRALSGGWSIKWQGASDDSWYQGRGETILEGLKKEFGASTILHKPTVDFDGNPDGDANSKDFLKAIKGADTVILCLGEKPYAEIVGNIDSLDLPFGQLDLIRKVKAQIQGTSTRVVLVLVEGRPRGLQETAGMVDAIVMAYLPGPWGGHPVAEVLSGTVNPSGRLPMTYPSGPSDMTTNYYRSGVDPYNPLFPFGAGLSYSKVEYRDLTLGNPTLHIRRCGVSQKNEQECDEADDVELESKNDVTVEGSQSKPTSIVADVTVQNTGNRAVKETVFWYITQDYRSDVMPEAFLLKGFDKVSLAPGQTKKVQFTVTRAALAYHSRSLRKKIEAGSFTLTVNAMRPEVQSVKFTVV
ncbi:hypothetical protein BGZ99_004024 [Dissophora globulifera]|uniref:beta-glucosidase n=1 Tax=Dissophora globulifera TaxID=979702 RepID=A0A9P6RIW8_9FUNG|nr:hypothetical protein BGZ99_004024 [Dissophora globulifera]